MSFLSFLKAAKANVSHLFILIFGKDASQKFADGAIDLLKTATGVIATDVVQLIEASNPLATPEDKRKLAFDKIKTDSKSAGLSITSSLVNLLIELAVQRLKANILPASEAL